VIDSGNPGVIEVMMRPAALSPSQVPVIAKSAVVEQRFDIDGTSVHITAVSMGNPHAVVFDAVGDQRRELGPKIQKHTSFPKSVNVGFATQVGEATLDLAVLERGAGWTEACGTGACAAAVAAVETKRVPRGKPVTVRLPGGALTIEVHAPSEPIKMTGPAHFVFEGELAR
jgi:diaminopimelate epimerase